MSRSDDERVADILEAATEIEVLVDAGREDRMDRRQRDDWPLDQRRAVRIEGG